MKLKLLTLILAISISINAQYTQLSDFTGNDSFSGSNPANEQNLISIGSFLYGLTAYGGVGDLGVLFKIKPNGTEYTKLYDFTSVANGTYPQGTLSFDGTFLYGTTNHGGTSDNGVFFKIKPDGTGYTKLFEFTGTATGAMPIGSLISDGSFLYGTTSEGGTSNKGVIFKIKPDGTGYVKLLDFTGAANGANPSSALIFEGNFLYGMTPSGGTANYGVIYKLKPDGSQYTKLIDFNGVEGGAPKGALISDGTFLYGTTAGGGFDNTNGVIFKIKPDGTGYVTLYTFTGFPDGKYPLGSLIAYGTFLYGTTRQGGQNNGGTCFKIKSDGTGYAQLASFYSSSGNTPIGSLIADGIFFYGMTSAGGLNGRGVIFKLRADGSDFIKLFDFSHARNGAAPMGSFISDGNYLYGMTQSGGVYKLGVVFKMKPDGTDFIKLLDFTGVVNPQTGANPWGSLISDGTSLYGMASSGGTKDRGVVFKIRTDGTGYAKLLDFTGEGEGSRPFGSLIFDGTFLYGLTQEGGTNDKGILFRIKPNGAGYTKLLDFEGEANGSTPRGTLISDGTYLYGMTQSGGVNNKGVIFKVKPDGTGYIKLLDFSGALNGSSPEGSLLLNGAFLYGMTLNGGTGNHGVIFKLKTDGTGYAKLLDFAGTSNGRLPSGSLIMDGPFLYGMTRAGGVNDRGTVFKLKPDGTDYSTLLTFEGSSNGSFPNGDLISDGNFLYGMTNFGGANFYGTLFKYKLSTSSSIAHNSTTNDFILSPNPSNGLFQLKVPENSIQNQLEIYSMLGAKIYSILIKNRQETINLNLPTGVYIVKLKSNSGETAKKLIIQK